MIRTQLAPESSDRKIPATPLMAPLMKRAGYVLPGAARPRPTTSACAALATGTKVLPLSVECHRPEIPPASQISPSWPGTALSFAEVGSPATPAAVKVAPPFVLI